MDGTSGHQKAAIILGSASSGRAGPGWRYWKGTVFLYLKVVQNCITSLSYIIVYLVSYCDCFFCPTVFSMHIFFPTDI